MISVEEAEELVKSSIEALPSITLKLGEALGFVLMEDMCSTIDMPPFPQSAMDGYALNFNDSCKFYKVIGEVAAGNSGEEFDLKEGEAIRIFTGAPVPKGANVVVQQEIVTKKGNEILVNKTIQLNDHIRPQGEQVKIGELALKKGTLITPAVVGYLSSIGVTTVNVYRKPKISIIATGNELIKPGNELPYGKIYESNSFMLRAALNNYGFNNVELYTVEDSFEATKESIVSCMEKSDVLLLSGGISVGDYDFVGKALHDIGVKQVFHKVKQKPGKPLYFGKKGDKVVFALPGNPAAALTSFYKYALLALNKLSGKGAVGLDLKKVPLKKALIKKGDRSQFLKARVLEDVVEVLEGQSSAMLQTYALSNAIVYVPSTENELKAGDLVSVYML